MTQSMTPTMTKTQQARGSGYSLQQLLQSRLAILYQADRSLSRMVQERGGGGGGAQGFIGIIFCRIHFHI